MGAEGKTTESNYKKNNTVQGLRGLSCMMVFLGHAFGMIPEEMKTGVCFQWSPLHIFYDGKIAVGIFWILSGFYIQKSMSDFSVMKYGYYLKKRLLRLYPMYVISLVVAILFCNIRLQYDSLFFSEWIAQFWTHKVGVDCFVKQMFMRGDFNAINPPLWTMKYEFNMIVFLPVITVVVTYIFRERKIKNLLYILGSMFIIVCGGGVQLRNSCHRNLGFTLLLVGGIDLYK